MTHAEPPGPETPRASPEPGAPALRRDRRAVGPDADAPPSPLPSAVPAETALAAPSGPAVPPTPIAAVTTPPIDTVPEPQPVMAARPAWYDVPVPYAIPLPPPPAPRRRRRTGLWVSIAAVVVVALAIGGLVAWNYTQEQQRLELARELSPVELGVLADAVSGSSEIAGQVDARREEFRTADRLWAESEASARSFHEQDDTPTVSVPNPGGDSMPGGDDERARALLDSIGANDVQILFDAGEQNCGYSGGASPGMLAIGGCYTSQYRDWLFLAWDEGVASDDVWPIFVHEAMHWYQWDRYVQLFESAHRAGIDADQYRGFIESDASCRAVAQHGIPRSAYAGSSAPCDVTDWYDTWLVDRLAELGVPVAAPDPETYEVQAVTRP